MIITVIQNITWLPPTACAITNSSEMVQIGKNKICTTIKCTIAFPKQGWCELFLRGLHNGIDKIDIYYIRELPCPIGFIKISSICQYYPFFDLFNIKCNIDDQTILRPTNYWILPIFQNISYRYEVSLHCPFHYCLPYSSHLNFSTPNSQCQFSRSGILCGHCQQGLSTVFGSSNCQQCSNIYLLLVVPIAIAGLVLVLLLFILNLTVTDASQQTKKKQDVPERESSTDRDDVAERHSSPADGIPERQSSPDPNGIPERQPSPDPNAAINYILAEANAFPPISPLKTPPIKKKTKKRHLAEDFTPLAIIRPRRK